VAKFFSSSTTVKKTWSSDRIMDDVLLFFEYTDTHTDTRTFKFFANCNPLGYPVIFAQLYPSEGIQ
jgi:hypothetical protein